jgi:hypothetical protein
VSSDAEYSTMQAGWAFEHGDLDGLHGISLHHVRRHIAEQNSSSVPLQCAHEPKAQGRAVVLIECMQYSNPGNQEVLLVAIGFSWAAGYDGEFLQIQRDA